MTCCRFGFISKVIYLIMWSVRATGWVHNGSGLFTVVLYLYMLARALTEWLNLAVLTALVENPHHPVLHTDLAVRNPVFDMRFVGVCLIFSHTLKTHTFYFRL